MQDLVVLMEGPVPTEDPAVPMDSPAAPIAHPGHARDVPIVRAVNAVRKDPRKSVTSWKPCVTCALPG
jgi:hypothetical protein